MDNKTHYSNDGFSHISYHFESNNANWFVNYDFTDATTAVVVCGADGIGVFFLVLKGNKVDEFKEIADKYKDFNKGINGELGECIRYACAHKDLIPERCTIGGVFSTNLKMCAIK